MSSSQNTLFQDEYFRVEQSLDPPIPGYVVVTSKVQATSIARLPPEALGELGPLLATASAAIERALAPERIYTLRFSEELEQVHFHLFPRTKEMAAQYLKAHPDRVGHPLSGAQLFDWARKAASQTGPGRLFTGPLEHVIQALKTEFDRTEI